MATSTCGKCGGYLFEIKENEPKGARFKTILVQCASCGVPVGTQEFYSAGALLKQQEKTLADHGKQLNQLATRFSEIERAVGMIAKVLQRLR